MPIPEIFNNSYNEFFTNRYLLLFFAITWIIQIFAYEMLFCGLFITGFSKNYSAKKSILVSAFLFGIMHFNLWLFIPVFIMGLFLGWIFYKTESILLCIYIRLFIAIIYLIKRFYSYNNPAVQFQPWWVYLIGLVLIAVGLILLIKAIKSKRIVTGITD